MVGKLLAGIEDGVDNGWSLIRADAGSLFFFSSSFASAVRLAVSEGQDDENLPFVCTAYLELSLGEPIGRRDSRILLGLAWATMWSECLMAQLF